MAKNNLPAAVNIPRATQVKPATYDSARSGGLISRDDFSGFLAGLLWVAAFAGIGSGQGRDLPG